MGLFQARRKKAEIIVEGIGIGPRTNRGRLISPPLKPGPVSVSGGYGPLLREGLPLARVEGRVNVDEVHARRRQGLEHGEALTEEDPMLHYGDKRVTTQPSPSRR